MNTLLVQPPVSVPSQPYLSIPSLVAFLNENKIKCRQFDLSLFMFDILFSKKTLKQFVFSKNKCAVALTLIKESEYEILKDFLLKNIENVKQTFKSPKALDHNVYIKTKAILSTALSSYSWFSKNESFTFENYYCKYKIKKVSHMKRFIKDFKSDNLCLPILEFIMSKAIKKMKINTIKVLGISLTYNSQIIPSLLLILLLKQENKNIKIILGGNLVSRWVDQLDKIDFLFDYIDYIIINEGESVLCELLKKLEDDVISDTIPDNIVYKKGKKLILKISKTHKNINELPTPVFNKWDIKNYYSPVPVLPLLTSRGCYWRKCSFCDHAYIYGNSYYAREKLKLKNDIISLITNYKCTNINFHDESLSVRQMKKIIDITGEINMPINWTSDFRFDKVFIGDILSKAKLSGLKVAFFGLESINQRVLNIMNKGTYSSDIYDILNTCHNNKIWAHLFFIRGFPTETFKEFEETINFLNVNNNLYQTSGHADFTLNKYSPVALSPEKYNITIMQNSDTLDTNFNYIENTPVYKKEASAKKKLNPDNLGSFSEIAQFIFRDHWLLFADRFFKYNELDDYWLFPWIILNKKNLSILDLKNAQVFYISK